MLMRPSRELRDLILGIYHDWARGDPSWVGRVISPDDITVGIGTDQEEWYVGGRNVRGILRQQVKEGGERVITAGELHAWEEGNFGVVADNPTFSTATGKTIRKRVSFFLRKERGAWQVVHMHESVGVPNIEVSGRQLTTSIQSIADDIERERPDLSSIGVSEGTVTIMFTDIEASTATNERIGDSRWIALIQGHHERVRAQAAAFGGSVVKSLGDGFMIAFASARRAVECAITLQRELLEFTSPSEAFRVRMGLHTGEPIREADDFFGRDVAYAARVAAAAAGGEILVSALVKSLIEPAGMFRFDVVRQLEFKGFEGLQSVFVVKWR
jgi:class 3 adenylate cyclase